MLECVVIIGHHPHSIVILFYRCIFCLVGILLVNVVYLLCMYLYVFLVYGRAPLMMLSQIDLRTNEIVRGNTRKSDAAL